MAVELAARLRIETQSLHQQVERSAFVAALLGGRLTQHAYALMLRNLEPIYFELEAGLKRHASNAGIQPLFNPLLFRLESLHHDLEILHGPLWRDELELLEGCSAYVARLTFLQECRPELLAAHAYVRYLGDLSGGQQLAEIVERSLALQIKNGRPYGTNFYNFGKPDDVRGLVKAFRDGLNALTDVGIPEEARLAFELHRRLFDELANHCDLPREVTKVN